MYNGEICLDDDEIQDFLDLGRKLKVKGLEDDLVHIQECEQDVEAILQTENNLGNLSLIQSKPRKLEGDRGKYFTNIHL